MINNHIYKKIVKKFENKLSSFCNTKYSIALNSGTSAIHLGLKILGVDSNSEVIVPSLTFIATVNPVLYLGAKPIIFDVDQYHNLKIIDVINFIKQETEFKNNKTINKNIQKFITKMGKKKMVAKPMCYYGNWDRKNPNKMSGKRMSVDGFFKQLRKDFKDDKVKREFISDCKRFMKGGKSGGKYGGGQSGGAWFTAGFFSKFVNISMGVTAIYILISGSAAQDSIITGFTALISGNCNSLAEMTYSYMGVGNPICNVWRSVWSTLLNSLAGDPTNIAKLTGTIVLIMKSPRWIPALHGQFILKLGNICVLGGIMSEDEFEQLTIMYSGSQVTEWGAGNVLGTGPTFEQLED